MNIHHEYVLTIILIVTTSLYYTIIYGTFDILRFIFYSVTQYMRNNSNEG